MLVVSLLFTALFVFQAISSVVDISTASAGTSNATNNSASIEQRQIRIFQQDMFNLDRTLTPTVTAQDYVISLDLAGNYTFNNLSKTLTLNNDTFTGTLFGIENLAAMHEPQIQMILDNIHNFTVSRDAKRIEYHATFVAEEKSSNLTASIVGTMQFQDPIMFDEILDRQDAIPDSSMMNVTLGTTLLNTIDISQGLEISQISIN